MTEGESSSTSQPFIDPQILVSSLASESAILSAADKDTPTLIRRFAGKWTVEIALKDCELVADISLSSLIRSAVERFSSAHEMPTSDTHFDVAGVLMSLNNSSYQSLGRPHARAVDVSDLRDALGLCSFCFGLCTSSLTT